MPFLMTVPEEEEAFVPEDIQYYNPSAIEQLRLPFGPPPTPPFYITTTVTGTGQYLNGVPDGITYLVGTQSQSTLPDILGNSIGNSTNAQTTAGGTLASLYSPFKYF